MINCKDTKCQKGFYRCCATCELLEVCNTACYNPSAKCEYAELTPTERRRAYRQQKQTRNITIAYIIVIALILSIGLLIIGNQNSIMMMQTDTLNTFNDMRMEDEVSWFDRDMDPEEYGELVTTPDELTEELTDVHNLSLDERDLIQRVVAAESRGESLEGQMVVAQTILDRSELWDKSVIEIVTAPGQYADPYQGKISGSVKLAVSNIFDDGQVVFDGPVTHFYSGAEPYWAEDKINRGSIARHTFMY